MSHLDLRLLGPFRAFLDGEEVAGIQSNKIRGLLAYLAVESNAVHSRARLAGLLWPDLETSRALGYLRHALTNLRQVLGEPENDPPALTVTRTTLQFNRAADHTLDFDVIMTYDAATTAAEPLELRLDAARCADNAYAGPFLDGFAIYDCPDFEHWLLHTRERVHACILSALDDLATYHETEGDLERGLDYVDRQLLVRPWHERAHQHKMRLLWQRGDRTAALMQFDICKQLLAEELDVGPSPSTMALHAKIQHAPTVTPPQHDALAANTYVSPVAFLPTELRTPLTPFIGRASELATITELIRSSRLVTLTGPGGVGKTRLALAAREEVATQFSDGAYAVALASIHHPNFVWHAVAAAVDISVQGDQSVHLRLADFFADRLALLLLDNVEHLLAIAPQLAELLRRAPRLHVLATSRAPLQIYGEQEVPVAPLALPVDEQADNLEETEAVQFFAHHVRLNTPTFRITPANAHAVARICVALDGLPLALELAASQLKYMSAAELGEQLEQRTGLAWADNGHRPQRLTSLTDTVAWTYRLLDTETQHLMRSLGVFSGGFTTTAAKAVHADVTQADEADIGHQLRTLLNFSLIQRVDDGTSVARYSMLETVRQFAANLLQESELDATTRRAHASFFTDLAEAMDRNSRHLGVHPQLAALDAEDDNLRGALHWTLEHNAPELALRLGAALGGYWITRFRMEEGIGWISRLLQLPASTDWPAFHARLHAFLGRLAELSGDYPRARAALTRAVLLARRLDERDEIALALSYQGLLHRTTGDSAQAKKLFSESTALYTDLGKRHGEVLNRTYTALCHHDLGELDAAEEQFLSALERASDLDDAFIKANLLWKLSDNLAAQGRFAESKELLVQAAARFKELQSSKTLAGYARVTAAQVAMAEEDYPEMLQAFRVSLEHSLRNSFFWGYTYELSACALALAKLGHTEDAYSLMSFVDAAMTRAGAPIDARRQALHEQIQQVVAEHLAPEAMSAAWQRGAYMTLREAATLALTRP